MKRDPWFERILRLYPRAFRARFGDELRALYSESSTNRLERRRFLTDLLLGAIGERLQSVQWIRFVVATGMLVTLAQSLTLMVYATQQRSAPDFLLGTAVSLVLFASWWLLPFAIIARLNRTPTWSEVFPLLGSVVSPLIWVVGGGSDQQVVTLIAYVIFYGSFIFYGFSRLKHSDLTGRGLKLSLTMHGFVLLFAPVAILSGLPFIEAWAIPWGFLRLIFFLGILIGLVFPITQPRAAATAA